MEPLLESVRRVQGYEFQASARPLLAALFEAAANGPACEIGAACFGTQAPSPAPTPAEEAARGAAQPPGGPEEGLGFEGASAAVQELFLRPGTSPRALVAVLGALPASWARAITLGPLRACMNWRATPHRARGSAHDHLHLLPYCQWCHATEGLRACEGCSVVAYCARGPCREADAPRHDGWCLDLLVSRLLWCALPHEALRWQELARRSPLTPLSPPPEVDRAGAEPPRSWEAYFHERWPALPALERCVLTECLSGPLTLLHVLRRLGVADGRPPGPAAPVRVLLVGADCEADQPWVEALPYLGHSLELEMVGPQLQDCSFKVGLPALGHSVSVTCHRGLLQDVAARLGGFDLAVALNSGMIFYPTWSGALPPILALGCPFVVTAWAMPESVGVRQVLVDAGFREPDVSANPFSSRCPHRVTDDHGTTNFGNMVLLATAPRQGRIWDALLRPGSGEPSEEDLRDALRLIQGHLEAAIDVRAPLEAILDSPDDYRGRLERAAKVGLEAPGDVARDMAEAYAALRRLSGRPEVEEMRA